MTNGWDRNIEHLLINWSKQVTINEQEYRKRGSVYGKVYSFLNGFNIIAQTGILTTLWTSINSANYSLILYVAIIDCLAFIASGLETFFNFGRASELYYSVANDHAALSRFIDSTLSLPRKDRNLARDTVLSIREQFDGLIKDNTIQLPPNKIVYKLEMCIYEDPREAIGNFSTPSSSHASLVNLDIDNVDNNDIRITIDAPPADNVKEEHETANSPPDLDPDEEIIGHAQKCDFRKNLILEKQKVKRDAVAKKGILSNLEYQWGRLEAHDTD